MILKFKLKNFASINEEIVLDLQASNDKTLKEHAVFQEGGKALLKTLVIYGPNASGKSNILKAFFVFRNMILESLLRSNLEVELPNNYFKLSSATIKKPSFFEMEFLLDEQVFSYGFEIDKKKIYSEWLKQKKGNKFLFQRSGQEIKNNRNYFKEATAALKKQTSERVLFLTLLASNNGNISKKIIEFFKNTNYIPGTERGSTLNFTVKKFLKGGKTAEKIRQLIIMADFDVIDVQASEKMILASEVKNIPDKFKELLFQENSKVAEQRLKFIHKKYNKGGKRIGEVPLDFFAEESEGTQQMFALSAPIIDTLDHGNILFIDEIDASLHPLLCQYIVALFNSKEKNPHNAQLVVTTHDISLLKNSLLRRDQIYFTDKNKLGATELFSLAGISERKGVDFAKRYLEGRYNALPYISDFENLKFTK